MYMILIILKAESEISSQRDEIDFQKKIDDPQGEKS